MQKIGSQWMAPLSLVVVIFFEPRNKKLRPSRIRVRENDKKCQINNI